MRKFFRSLKLITCFYVIAIPLNTAFAADLLNIDLGDIQGTPSSGFGTVTSQAGTWNTITSDGPVTLMDLSGTATGVSLQSSFLFYGAGWGPYGDPDPRALLNDNAQSGTGESWSMQFSGLTNGTYRVYLYAPSLSSAVTGPMVVNGTSVASLPGDPTWPFTHFILGTSYTSVDISVSGGSLSISGGGVSGQVCGLAGLQLTSAPTQTIPTVSEWGMIIFFILLTVSALWVMRRRKKQKAE